MAEISLSELATKLGEENQQSFSGLVAPVENAPQEHFNTMDWVDAIWQTGNSVRAAEAYGASITDTQHIPDIPEENMYESLKPYAGYLDRFSGVTSAREVAQIKSRIDNEMLNGRVMSEHGFWSNLLMTVPAALGDPLNLVGFGEAAAPLKLANAARTVELAQNATRFAKGAARVAAEMTPSTLALYATSETQTPADLALNYSLGLGLAGMIHSVPYVKKAMTENGVALEDTAVAATHFINAEKSMGAAEARTTGIAQHEEGRTPEQIMQDMQVVGENVISKTGQQFIDPLYRAQTSSVPEARVAAAALNDSHLMTREMLPTVDENGVITDWGREKQVSVQAIARGFIGAHESAVADMRSFYQAYRVATGHAAPKSHTVTVIGDFVTRPKGLMTIDDFSEKVGFALRNDDTALKSADPEADKYVTEAAKSFRQKVYNPIFERAKEAGLIDDDVELKTSASYLNRIYDVDKIVANRATFSQKISNYLIGRRAVVEEMLPKMTDEIKKLYDTQSSVMAKVKENDDAIKIGSEKNMMATGKTGKIKVDPEKLSKQIADTEHLIKQTSEKTESEALKKQKQVISDKESVLEKTKKEVDEAIKNSPDAALLDKRIDEKIRELAPKAGWAQKGGNIIREFDDGSGIKGEVTGRTQWIPNEPWWDGTMGTTEETLHALDKFQAGGKLGKAQLEKLGMWVAVVEDEYRIAYDPKTFTPAPKVKALGSKTLSEAENAVKAAREKHAEIMAKDKENARLERYALDDKLKELKAKEEVVNRTSDLERLKKENESHSNYIRKLSRQILMKHESLDVANELLSGNVQKLTDEIFHKITGTGGRLSNSFDTEVGARGSALERTLGIQDSEIQDFLQNDIRLASEQYAKTLGMDVALTEKFGDPAMTATLDKIKQQYQEKMSGLEGKPLIKMQKEMNNVIKSIEGNRDRLRGTFERPDRDKWFSELMHRAAFFAKSANTLRLMGGTLIASLGDPMNMIMTYGLSSFLRDGLVPMVKSLSSSKAANLSADELKLGGTALEIERSGVWGAKNEVWDGEGSDTVAEKALKSMTRTFGFVSLVAPWNQMMKRVAGTIVQNNVLKNVMRYESLSAKEVRDLNQIGIGKEKALAIKEQISRLESEGHVMNQDGVMLAKSKMWDDTKLQEHYRSAIASEVDRIHVTPGGEKPLFMSTALGSVIMQFKTFIIASHHRIILAGLQRHDANFLQGIIGLTAMGMLIYKLKKGDKVSDKPQDWVREGLDRGGVLGWFMEANNMASGATGGQADIFKLIGAEKPVSRYQTRGAVGSLLGPTFGAAQDSYGILRDIAKGEVDQSTMHKARTLLPFQNVFYAKGIMDTGEENISAYFGGM